MRPWRQFELDDRGQPHPIELIRDLRETLRIPSGALDMSPQVAWEDAIEEVRRIVDYWAHSAQSAQPADQEHHPQVDIEGATFPPASETCAPERTAEGTDQRRLHQFDRVEAEVHDTHVGYCRCGWHTEPLASNFVAEIAVDRHVQLVERSRPDLLVPERATHAGVEARRTERPSTTTMNPSNYEDKGAKPWPTWPRRRDRRV